MPFLHWLLLEQRKCAISLKQQGKGYEPDKATPFSQHPWTPLWVVAVICPVICYSCSVSHQASVHGEPDNSFISINKFYHLFNNNVNVYINIYTIYVICIYFWNTSRSPICTARVLMNVVAIHQNMINLPGLIPLKKNPSPKVIKLLIALYGWKLVPEFSGILTVLILLMTVHS